MEAQEKLTTEAQQEIARLNEEVQSQRLAMVELEERSDRTALEAEVTALKQTISESEMESKTATERAEKSKQEIASLKDEIENAQLKTREVAEAKDVAQSKLDLLELALAEKDDAIELQKSELAQQKALSDIVASQKVEILGLTDSLSTVTIGKEAVEQDLDRAQQQLKEAQNQIDELKSASSEAQQQLQKSARNLRTEQEEKVFLEQTVARLKLESEQLGSDHQSALGNLADLESKTQHLKSLIAELEDQQSQKQSADTKLLLEKNEALNKQVGQLESASKRAETANEQLKEMVSTQKRRIGELEASVGSAAEAAQVQSDAATASNAALMKIETTLAEQTMRVKSMEVAHQQSLAKIAELEARPAEVASPPENSKSPAQTGLGAKLSDISGIGPTYQKKLQAHGVKTIEEIANWSGDDIKTFAGKLGCGEKVAAGWKEKAQALVGK